MVLSIVTVCYNNSQGLSRTLASVLPQKSCQNFEHIIIDGGSIDGSADVIQKYAENSSYDVKWVSERDFGIYNAMNKGIDMSQGDYIIFLNGGDYFANDFVIDLFCSNIGEYDLLSGYVIEDVSGQKIAFPEGHNPLISLLWHNLPHQALFIRKTLFFKIGHYSEDIKILSDYEFNIKAIKNHYRLKVINEQISFVEPNGISSIPSQRMKEECDIVQRRTFPKYLLFYKSVYNWIKAL